MLTLSDKLCFQNLPKVNKDLALKLADDERNMKKKNNASSILRDNRFKALFENPDFHIDPNSEEYRFVVLSVYFYVIFSI